MQNLSDIRQLLDAAGVKPNPRMGQNFLVDGNLMALLLELADVGSDDTILEVGPAMGSLTEDLLETAGAVIAVEMDPTLAKILRRRLGENEKLTILARDVLAGKQRPDGSWVNTESRWFEANPVLVTCYSVLALREALAK